MPINEKTKQKNDGQSYSSRLMLMLDIVVVTSELKGRKKNEERSKTLCGGRVQCTRLRHTHAHTSPVQKVATDLRTHHSRPHGIKVYIQIQRTPDRAVCTHTYNKQHYTIFEYLTTATPVMSLSFYVHRTSFFTHSKHHARKHFSFQVLTPFYVLHVQEGWVRATSPTPLSFMSP